MDTKSATASVVTDDEKSDLALASKRKRFPVRFNCSHFAVSIVGIIIVVVATVVITTITLQASNRSESVRCLESACPNSQCCSLDGWCGTGIAYCGFGCNPKFGRCDVTTGASAAPNIFPDTTTGNCSHTSGQCQNNLCCSLKGQCGDNLEACGLGCKPLYGRCDTPQPTATSPAVSFKGNSTPTNFTVSPMYFNCTVPGTYALTFDDGPYIYTEQLLDHLDAINAKATFFMNGLSWGGAGCIYDFDRVLKRMLLEGHQLAHHTWDHKMITTLTEEQFISEITQVEVALRKIVGVTPAFFRPPYGVFDPSGLFDPTTTGDYNFTSTANLNTTYLKILGQRGYRTILWDATTNDANRGGLETELATAIYDDSLNGTTNLVLNHDPYNSTVNVVVPYALKKIAAAGYKMVTVGECLGFPMEQWYQSRVPPSPPDTTWHC